MKAQLLILPKALAWGHETFQGAVNPKLKLGENEMLSFSHDYPLRGGIDSLSRFLDRAAPPSTSLPPEPSFPSTV